MVLTRLRHEGRLVCVAVQYFTRLPTPALRDFDPAWLTQSVRYFPLAGALVGLIGAAVLWLAAQLLPLPVAALIALAATVAVTGAFHEDGLADTFDALGGSVPTHRALEIMRDSRIGTYGAGALILSLLLRWQLLYALPLPLAMAVLVSSHAAARAGAASLMANLDYVRVEVEAKAKPVAHSLTGANLLSTLALGLLPMVGIAIAVPAWWAPLLAGALAVVVVRLWCAHWFRQRLQGYTGDALGCAEQLGEIAFSMAALATLALLG